MAEGLEACHVPQQSRRDKLRVVAQNHSDLHGCVGLLPLYDPLILSSALLPCANNSLSGVSHLSQACKENPVCAVNASSSATHHPYMDPQSSLPVNASSIQDINGDPLFYSSDKFQNLRDFDNPYNGACQVFKPEPLSLVRDSTTTGQGLSLSLSSHHTHQSNVPLELNSQRYGSTFYRDKVAVSGHMVPGIVGGNGSTSTSNEVSRSCVPLAPFTGYASILKGSRFLKPAQQLLEEFCDVGSRTYGEKMAVDASLVYPPIECLNASRSVDDSLIYGEIRRKKSRLISILDEVYRRYKQYYQQMQVVVASFECVSGLSNAAPYANLALNAMAKHFRSFKNAITDQLQFNKTDHGQLSDRKEQAARFGNTDRSLYNQRPLQNSGFIEHQPIWRPQRGLPESAVTVLRAWLFEHFLHPYPTDTDKLMLAKQTGLTRSQVSNWFINARVRLWKPMVEEIHMLETRQAQNPYRRGEQKANRSSDQVPLTNSFRPSSPLTSTQRAQDA